MSRCLRLGLAVFLVASSCSGFPAANPENEAKAENLPKDEYRDVIRLLNSSAFLGSEDLSKGAHDVEKAKGGHTHPLIHTDSFGASNPSKKSPKLSKGKKKKTRKIKKKHFVKSEDKINIGDPNLMNDSPSNDRVREVLSRRRTASKLLAPTMNTAKLRQLLPQPAYQPNQNQLNYYNYQSPYPAYYNDYSVAPASPYIIPQYPLQYENNNWDNNIQVHQLPSQQVATVPKVEPPKISWTAEIEYPNMPPIVISDQNYTNNPNVEVLLHTASKSPDATDISVHETAVAPLQPNKNWPVSSWNARINNNNPPPIIWSHGIPYVPLREPGYLESSQPYPQYNPTTSYNSMTNPYNFVSPPVYYQPPQNIPYTHNTPVQTWLPSNQPYYHSSPSVLEQPRYNQDHNGNAQPTHSVQSGAVHATVFHGSQEVTGEKLEVNVFPAGASAAEDRDGEEVEPKGAVALTEDDD